MKANTVTKFAMGLALSIAVAFGPATMASAQEAAAPAAEKAAPAAKKAATKKAKVVTACTGLDEAGCKAAADKKCKWNPKRTVNGKQRKAKCVMKKGSPCKGLDEAACTAKADKRCAWIADAVTKKGKKRKPFCKRAPK